MRAAIERVSRGRFHRSGKSSDAVLRNEKREWNKVYRAVVRVIKTNPDRLAVWRDKFDRNTKIVGFPAGCPIVPPSRKCTRHVAGPVIGALQVFDKAVSLALSNADAYVGRGDPDLSDPHSGRG